MLPGYVIPIAPKKAGLAVAGVSDTRRDHDLLGDVNVPASDNSVSTCFHPQTDIRAAVPLSAHTSVWAIHSAYAAENASIRTRLLPLDSCQSSDTRSACPGAVLPDMFQALPAGITNRAQHPGRLRAPVPSIVDSMV